MKKIILTTLLAAVMLFTSACIGPMNTTSRLKTWNREIENRWGGEVVFLLLQVPYGGIYTLTFLSDILVFNSIEFWGGDNPVAPVSMDRLEAVKALDEQRHGR